jgi:hypothetical protein
VVLESRTKLDDKKLAQQKYDLIKEIKSVYPIESFLKGNIKNYRVLASVYKILENRSSSRTDVNDLVQSRESVTDSLVNKLSRKSDVEEKLVEYYKQQSEDIRLIAYKILLEGMNNKYKDFDENQKKLLREYILNVSNTNALSKFVCEEVKNIKSQLSVFSSNVNDNDVVKIKLNEISKVLSRIKPSTVVKDSHVMTLMLSYELIKELNNLK